MRLRTSALVFALLATVAVSAQAQSGAIAGSSNNVTPSSDRLGPSLAATSVALRTSSTPSAHSTNRLIPAADGGGGFSTPVKFMIVGGAAFLAGAIIQNDPGTIIMVAGAGVGLYGLYLYLNNPATADLAARADAARR
ncbi:MAG: hypothetical protein M3081_11900 [Gemmatimonadota bacterium]|nr:hypothetical protein [Gemmatimonadota bacterium]